jgi:hypothetical protein
VSRIFVLTEQDPLSRVQSNVVVGQDAVATGFWLSEDSVRGITGLDGKGGLSLDKTVKEYPVYVERAYSLAHPIAGHSPSYRGIKPLLAWEEVLADSILKYLVIGDFHQGLRDRYDDKPEVVFFSPSETQRAFSLFNEVRDCPFRVTVLHHRETVEGEQGLFGRLREFRKVLLESKQGGEWGPVFWQPMEVLDDRYRIRSSVWPRARFTRGGRWFYGSYVNYTRVLRRHRNDLKGHVNWVVNQNAATRGLQQNDRWHYLWQFGRPSRSKDHEPFLRETVNYLQTLPLGRDGFPLRDFVRSSTSLSYLVTRILPSALAEVDLMDAFLTAASPDELWVANQWGSEGELMMLAKARGIPVTQVQHGALHRYFAVAPVLSDRFLVWGSFWRSALKTREAGNVEIVNPGFDVPPLDRHATIGAKRRVTFLTTPLHLGAFWNPEATLREVAELVRRLIGRGHPVLMRIHPSDRVEVWERSLRTAMGSLPPGLRFSKEGSLESVLRETDVAFMFFSTVFLNCVASGIPVIGLGWYPHIWQKPLEATGTVHFARSLSEAIDLAETAEVPRGEKNVVDEFIARPSCVGSHP